MIIKLKFNLFTYISRKDFSVAFLKCNRHERIFHKSYEWEVIIFSSVQYKSSSNKPPGTCSILSTRVSAVK